ADLKRVRAVRRRPVDMDLARVCVVGDQDQHVLGAELLARDDVARELSDLHRTAANMRPAVGQVDVADVLLCGPIHDRRAGVAVQAAPKRDRDALPCHHSHCCQLVDGASPHGWNRSWDQRSTPTRSTKIPWNTARIVIVTSIADSPSALRPPTIAASLASACRTTRISAPGTRTTTGARSRYRTTCGTGSGASKSRPSSGCVVQPVITGPPSGRTSSAP